MGIIIWGAKRDNYKKINYKYYCLFLTWFLLPFLIGFFYSKFFSSVLQFSVLIFSFPFLFLVLFGHIKPQKTKTNLVIVSLILSVNVLTLVLERKHYDLFYHNVLKEILLDYDEVNQSSNNTLFIVDSFENITNYYSDKLKIDIDFVAYNSFDNISDFKLFIEENKNYKNLFFGCLSAIDPLCIPIIEEYYPKIEWRRDYVGGSTYLFSKRGFGDNNKLIAHLDFESKESDLWSSIDSLKITGSISLSGVNSYMIDSETEWGPSFCEDLNNIILNENDFIDVSVKVKSIDSLDGVVLVTTLSVGDDNVYWGGVDFSNFTLLNKIENEWVTIHSSVKLSDIDISYRDIKVKVYIWNKGKRNLFIDDFEVNLRLGNPIIYGLNEKISRQ